MTLSARATALAAELSRTRIITPVLTDDAATFTVVLDEAAILAALEETRREAIKEAAKIASQKSPDAETFWVSMTTLWRSGYIAARKEAAAAIRALLDPPDSKRPGTPADDSP